VDGKAIRWYKLKKRISLDREEDAIDAVKSSLNGRMDFFLGEKNVRAVLAQGSLYSSSSSVIELEKMQTRSAILRLLLNGVSPASPALKSKVKASHCLGILERKYLRAGLPKYFSLLLSRES